MLDKKHKRRRMNQVLALKAARKVDEVAKKEQPLTDDADGAVESVCLKFVQEHVGRPIPEGNVDEV